MIKEEQVFKPTIAKPVSTQSKNFEKNFGTEIRKQGLKGIKESEDVLNEVDGLLSEAEQSLKKKIFSLAKMEALVFSDPKLSAVYDEMSVNGEEKYGYHYNETIMNMLFNDYVLNSPKYLQKYKQAVPKEKKRRDKSGINSLKKAGEETMQTRNKVDEGGEELTKVMFLVNETDPENKDVYAYFPEEAHNAEYKTAYSHIGQHSAIHPAYAAESRPATPEEYQDLKAELESMGYALEVLNPANETTGAGGGGAGAFVGPLGYEKKVEETTTAGSAGGAAGYVGYAGPAAWGGGDLKKAKGKSKAMRVPIIKGGTFIQESNYLTDPSGFEKYVNMLNEDVEDDFIVDKTSAFTSGSVKNWNDNDKKIELDTLKTGKMDTPNLKTESTLTNFYQNLNPNQAVQKATTDYSLARKNNNISQLDKIAGNLKSHLESQGYNWKQDPYAMEILGDFIQEVAKSKSQQRLFGMAHAVQKGELSPNKVGGAVKNIAKTVAPDDVEDFASTKHEKLPEKIKEDATSMANASKQQPKEDSMSNKMETQMPIGAQSTGGSMNESDMKLLEELNNELNAYSIHQEKLMKMSEDRKPSALVLRDRVGSENEKNFKKDLQHSGTKEIIDVEKELQYKDQQTDVPNDPQKLGLDIEKKAMSGGKDKALENVGNSDNENGKEIPKRNLTTKEQDEVNNYRLGQHSLVYDNEPSKKFQDRMEADMGPEVTAIREKQLKFRGEAPMYNKDTQPTEKGIEKPQYDKEKSMWNQRTGIQEAMVTGRFSDALNKKHLIDFKLNEVTIVESVDENLFKLDFTGLGNTYNSKTVDKKVIVNEAVVDVMNTNIFYTDGKKVFATKSAQNLSESVKNDKPIVNEQHEKMKHLLGYKPNDFVSTTNVKNNRGF